MKKKIEDALQNGKLEEVKELIKEYESIHPMDYDLLSYKCIYNIYIGDYEEAKRLGEIGIRRYPTSYEMYYNLASVYEEKGDIIEALKNYKISINLIDWTGAKSGIELVDDISNRINYLNEQLTEMAEKAMTEKNIELIQKISSHICRESVVYGKDEKSTRNKNKSMIGEKYWVTDDEQRYIGAYKYPHTGYLNDDIGDLARWKGEFLKYTQGKKFIVNGNADEYFLPIATDETNFHLFLENGEKYLIKQIYNKQFQYYRVKNNTGVISNEVAYYGEPIPIEHKKHRKKLVLNIFLDGLSQEVINGDNFNENMPFTNKFFSKGTVCTNAYSASEWTFPSLATYASGLDTLGHMMFHNTIDGELPRDITTLAEYFKEQGYYTAKIDGDWRCIYSYGFARGTDQYVYQIQHMGTRVEQEVNDIIEHIESFKETDQYIWMTIGDLHDVADGFTLPVNVQNQLSLKERVSEKNGETSVKQKYSDNKIKAYKKMVKYCDLMLSNLYNYIENNYKDEEILISLFADHGQGYLVPDGEHFLSKCRTKVALMFRGGECSKESTNELICTTDYLPIMCKLSGIELKKENIQGCLPEIFGGKKREYVLSESIHPGDVYCAVIRTKDMEIYFDNTEKTRQDGRFVLGNYKVYGKTYEGEEIEDKEVLGKYEKIFLSRIEPYIIYQ